MRRSTFTVVAIADSPSHPFVTDSSSFFASETQQLLPSSPLQPLLPSSKYLGSKHELVIRRGDIIRVIEACNPNGSQRRPVPRAAKRLNSGFLDTQAPIHEPASEAEWWVGTICMKSHSSNSSSGESASDEKRSSGDVRQRTGRFPQRLVAMTEDLRETNQMFRCKLCTLMKKDYVVDKMLHIFNITGEEHHVFGERDLCHSCGSKLVRAVKSVADSIILPADGLNPEALLSLRNLSETILLHETIKQRHDTNKQNLSQNLLTPLAPLAGGAHRPEGMPTSSTLSPRSKNLKNKKVLRAIEEDSIGQQQKQEIIKIENTKITEEAEAAVAVAVAVAAPRAAQEEKNSAKPNEYQRKIIFLEKQTKDAEKKRREAERVMELAERRRQESMQSMERVETKSLETEKELKEVRALLSASDNKLVSLEQAHEQMQIELSLLRGEKREREMKEESQRAATQISETNGLPSIDQSMLSMLFHTYDTTGTGSLDARSFASFMKEVHEMACEHDTNRVMEVWKEAFDMHAQEMIDSHDTDGDGRLDFQELCSWLEVSLAMTEGEREAWSKRGGYHGEDIRFVEDVCLGLRTDD